MAISPIYLPAAYNLLPISHDFLPTAYGLTAVGVWGTSDFLGGIGAKRANAFLFTSVVHLSGLVLAAALAFGAGLPIPGRASMLWALAGGTSGGAALALFYRALATGKMGLVAPVAAVLGAGIPTVVTALREGFPGWRHAIGFLLAGVGVWLISRTEEGADRPEGLGLAMLAGCGFAGFYLCTHEAGSGSALWLAVGSRLASLGVTAVIVVAGGFWGALPRAVFWIAVAGGICEITGSAAFIRAAQIGRLDAAAVISSLYPAVTVVLARIFLHEHFSRGRTVGMMAALLAVPMIAG